MSDEPLSGRCPYKVRGGRRSQAAAAVHRHAATWPRTTEVELDPRSIARKGPHRMGGRPKHMNPDTVGHLAGHEAIASTTKTRLKRQVRCPSHSRRRDRPDLCRGCWRSTSGSGRAHSKEWWAWPTNVLRDLIRRAARCLGLRITLWRRFEGVLRCWLRARRRGRCDVAPAIPG
jgi:hypothetical protein